MKQEDLRVKRTKNALRTTLFALLEEKPLADISVKELTECAGVARATFYLYYDNIEDMMSTLVDELYAEFEASVDEIVENNRDVREIISLLLQNLMVKSEEFRPLAMLLYGEHGDADFVDVGYQYVRQKMQDLFTTSDEGWKMDYVMEYLFGGVKNMLSYWVKNGTAHSLEEISELASEITFHLEDFLKDVHRK